MKKPVPVFWDGTNYDEVKAILGPTRAILARTWGEYLLGQDHLEVKRTPGGAFERVPRRRWLVLRGDGEIEVLAPSEFAIRVEE